MGGSGDGSPRIDSCYCASPGGSKSAAATCPLGTRGWEGPTTPCVREGPAPPPTPPFPHRTASNWHAGGSLTSAIVLTLLAWGVRWLRQELDKRKREEAAATRQLARSPGRFYARLSPAALRMLVRGR